MDFFRNTRVLELASVLAGPSVGQFFAELGAEVIKVENLRSGGDVTRGWKTAGENTDDRSAYFCSVNWGKKSVALDLNSTEGQEVVHKLASRSHIVIASYKPGDAAKLRVDYETLSALNPTLIYGQVTGYGPGNPRVGYDAVIQAEAGFMFINGEPGRSSLKMPVALMDVLAAHHLKEGILLALLNRTITGKGSLVAVSLLEAAVSSLVNQATNYLVGGEMPRKQGSSHPNIAPYGDVFKTKDDEEIILAVGSDKQFQSLCTVLDLPDLIGNERFSTNQQRVKHRDMLHGLLQAAIREFTSKDLMPHLIHAHIPGGIVQNLAAVFNMEQIRNLVLREGRLAGVRTFAANLDFVTSLSGGLLPPPHLGEHTALVLSQLDRDQSPF